MDYYSFTDPGGTEGCFGPVGWPTAGGQLTDKWSPVNHSSGTGRGNAESRRLILTSAVLSSAVDFVASVADTSKAWNEVLARSVAANVWNQSTLVDVCTPHTTHSLIVVMTGFISKGTRGNAVSIVIVFKNTLWMALQPFSVQKMH